MRTQKDINPYVEGVSRRLNPAKLKPLINISILVISPPENNNPTSDFESAKILTRAICSYVAIPPAPETVCPGKALMKLDAFDTVSVLM